MDKKIYTYDELCRMSYQELRRISILFRLPANIKKKHMISMIEAHQNGDGQTKTEIANKVIEERNLRRMNTQMKRTKPFILSSRVRTHQVSTDLSVATKHEFETTYSYVAHYTKGNKGEEISGILREEAEVSRRNQSVVQQSSKSSRKLSAVGRTEIMLPRNHSLTTMVQLMPQHERNFIPSSKGARVLNGETNWSGNVSYDSVSTPPTQSEYHCQATGQFVYGGLPFPGDYGNSFVSPGAHDLYRNLPYWHARQYESFVRCSGGERDLDGSGGLLTGYTTQETCFSGNATKSEEPSDWGYRRYDGRHVGESQHNENLTYLVDIFAPKSRGMYPGNVRQDYEGGYPLIRARNAEEMCRNGKDGYQSCEVEKEKPDGYEMEEEEEEEEEEVVFGDRQEGNEQGTCIEEARYDFPCQQDQGVLPSFISTFHEMHSSGSDHSEMCLNPSDENRINTIASFCRYLSGHNNSPEAMSRPLSMSDSSVASSGERDRDRSYSQCRYSSTGTTVVHRQPIMASTNIGRYEMRETERGWNVSDVGSEQPTEEAVPNNNTENLHHYQRPIYYPYAEEHSPYGVVEGNPYSHWNEFNEDLETKIAQNNGHDVRVVQCKRHGYHYLYALSTSQ